MTPDLKYLCLRLHKRQFGRPLGQDALRCRVHGTVRSLAVRHVLVTFRTVEKEDPSITVVGTVEVLNPGKMYVVRQGLSVDVTYRVLRYPFSGVYPRGPPVTSRGGRGGHEDWASMELQEPGEP